MEDQANPHNSDHHTSPVADTVGHVEFTSPVTPPDQRHVRISPSTGPWSKALLQQAALGKAPQGVLDTEVRRSDRKKSQLKGFRRSCQDDSCLGCSLNPPTLSPALIRNLGSDFCKVDPAKLQDNMLLKKKKVVAPVEKKQLKKKKNTKEVDDAKQTKKKPKK
ncbi:unnamed protein product [Urochloa humidicola]